ncbi:MAG TPA: CheR family methyltransferase [Opitutaceae bacterium]|jgi:chemotaxis protein methyltransferase CheR|nr:CheR family methyltransferase [Opitutaceae bacterium]
MSLPAESEPPALSAPAGVPLLLRDLLHENTGIYFEPERFDTMLDKLAERARVRGCRSYLDYYYLLKYDDPGREEWLRVMDAFSVQETYFWREQGQIAALAQVLVPRWFERTAAPLKIWSAACATGEEPISLGIALREAGWGGRPITIVASDASEAALAKARLGVYRERSFRSLPETLRQKYFEPAERGWRARTELLPPIEFRRANLVDPEQVAPLATAPVIFCRNVFIYFSADSIRRTVGLFAQGMPDGGHLFVGAPESLVKLTDDFELREMADAFVYERKART